MISHIFYLKKERFNDSFFDENKYKLRDVTIRQTSPSEKLPEFRHFNSNDDRINNLCQEEKLMIL